MSKGYTVTARRKRKAAASKSSVKVGRSIRDITQAQEQIKQVAKVFDNFGYAMLLVTFAPFLTPLFLHLGDNTVNPKPESVPGFFLSITAYVTLQMVAVLLMGAVDKMNVEKELLKEKS